MLRADIPPISSTTIRRFEKFVHYEPNSGCWLWSGSTSTFGYGSFGIGNRNFRASRIAWAIKHGSTPPGMLVCHRCDNPPCVNPDHLFLGTQSDNMKDCIRKNRNPKRRAKDPDVCRNGHSLTPDNLGLEDGIWRRCMKCYKARIVRNTEARRRAALAALGGE